MVTWMASVLTILAWAVRRDDKIRMRNKVNKVYGPGPVTDVDKLHARLNELGICTTCLEEFTHDVAEPFSYCSCGCGEWAGSLPLLFDLRRKAAAGEELKVAFNQFMDDMGIERTRSDGFSMSWGRNAVQEAERKGL